MYNRVGRGLLIVGRQIRRKLCENASGAAGCATTAHRAPINYRFTRGYCDKKADEPPVVATPQLLTPDEDAQLQLEKLLVDPQIERKQKIIEMEIEVMRQNSQTVPETLRPRHWIELLNLNSRGTRRRYLTFLFGLEKKHENQAAMKARKREIYMQKLANPEEDDEKTLYRLGANSMFLRFYDATINHMYHSRLINRMVFGQQLVLDCSYESHMSRQETKNCAKQMQLTFAENRVHDDPFDLYFCNANVHGDLMRHFHRFIPTVYNPEFPLNIRSESYLDVFDKEKLIYLTPHCSEEMTTFDHDAVYIIGAFVDKGPNQPVSLAKAKKEGLKMLKFPLDRYMQWGSSSGKNLTINQVLKILLDLRLTGSWEKALNATVPHRKLRRDDRQHQGIRRFRYEESSDEHNTSRKYSLPEYNSSPMQPLKLKERFTYQADRSFRPKENAELRNNKSNTEQNESTVAPRDFSIKSRARFKNNWKD